MEMNYKGALLGILSEKKNSGAHADTVRAGGLPAKISVHSGDSIKELAIEINGGDAQILPVKDVLNLTNKSWQPMLPESEDSANDMGDIPNRAALKNHMVEWRKLDNLAIPDMRKSIFIGLKLANPDDAGITAWDIGCFAATLAARPDLSRTLAAAISYATPIGTPTPTATSTLPDVAAKELAERRKTFGDSLLQNMLEVIDAYPRQELQNSAAQVTGLATKGVATSPQLVAGIMRKVAKLTYTVVPSATAGAEQSSRPAQHTAAEIGGGNDARSALLQTLLDQMQTHRDGGGGGNRPTATGVGPDGAPPTSPPRDGGLPSDRRRSPRLERAGFAPTRASKHFDQLIPKGERAPPAEVIERIAQNLHLPDSKKITEILKDASKRFACEASAGLLDYDPIRRATQAATDWAVIMETFERELPDDFFSKPISWDEATNKFITATTIALAAAQANDTTAPHNTATLPSTSSLTGERERLQVALGPRRRLTAVAESAKDADGAVPATMLTKLATQEVARVEVAAAASAHERSTKQNVRRIIDTHGNDAWGVIYSNGRAIGSSRDAVDIAGHILDNRDYIFEECESELITNHIGPSTRLQAQLKTDITTTRDAVMTGAFEGNLKAIVAVLGSTPSADGIVEAGANPNDPAAGRAGSLDKLYIQSDMPRALTNLAKFIGDYHGEAGGAVVHAGRDADLGLLKLWTAASVLPLTTTTMRCGTEVVGSIRLIEEVLRRWTRLVREKRRRNLSVPLDFKEAVDWVIGKELAAATQQQLMFTFMNQASNHSNSGKRSSEEERAKDTSKKPKQDAAQKQSGPPKQPAQQGNRSEAPAAAQQPAQQAKQLVAPPWLPLKKGLITHLCNPKGAVPEKVNLIRTCEYFLQSHMPTLKSSELPCAWDFCLEAGCTNKKCVRCEHQRQLVARKQGPTPTPPGLRDRLRNACAPPIAELMRKQK